MGGRLAHFLPFLREVIQADRWVLQIVSQGYCVELLQTPKFRGVRNKTLNEVSLTSIYILLLGESLKELEQSVQTTLQVLT